MQTVSATLTLPPALTRQFDNLRHRLWRFDALVAASGAIGSLLLAWMFQFLSDRLWDTPLALRIFIAVCGWAGFAFFGWRYGSRWIWGRPSIQALAITVQKCHRRLGDRLLGIVELSDPAARPFNFSPELCRAAIDQVAGEASSFDFDRAAGERRPRQWLSAFLALAFIALLIACCAPGAGWNALLRWLWPAANVARYTFVTIEPLPDHLVVPQGEPFDIAVRLAADTHWHPRQASAHFDGSPLLQAPVTNGVATLRFPGQTQQRVLSISIGDVARSIGITPAVRPDLRQLTVRLQLPSYLEYPPVEQRIDTGSLNFLPGTYATFTGQAERNLASAAMRDEIAPVKIDGSRFTTAPILLELERDLSFTWRDGLGLDGPAPAVVRVVPHEDEPPQVDLRGLPAAIAILPEETVPIDVASTDDYGVRRLTFAWQTGAASPEQPPGPLHEIKLTEGQPRAKSLAGHYDFCPAILHIPADTTILVRALAVDYYPSRQPASSPLYRIHVLSREAHARLIHDEFEKVAEQLEELTRRQAAILQSGQAVRSQPAPKLANDDSAQHLAEQSSEQKETASHLKDLAAQTAALLTEAMRNPEISQDTLKDWANRTEQMNQIATGPMPDAAKSLDTAGAAPSQRPQNLDHALAGERQILDALRQMGKQAGDSLDQLKAQTLAARLRRAAGAEREIADQFQKSLPGDIGLTANQLPGDSRTALADMSARHAEVTREAGRLQDEISRLFDRTSLNRYGDVAHDMDSMKTSDALAALGALVAKNVGVQSIETARRWSDQFEKWAARLEDKDNSHSAGQPSGKAPSSLESLLALMRIRQQQDQLREQTSVLEEQKQTTDDYSSGAQDAMHRQSALRDTTGSLAQAPGFPLSADKLAPISKAMGDASTLLAKPETGKPTYNAQTDAINLLDAAIADQAGKSGQSAASLAAMMNAAGSGRGNGNTGGGGASGPNIHVPGSSEGPAAGQRPVSQATGIDNSQLPPEFRDAIESYHRTIHP